jgi:hypothetical protein
MKIRSLSFVFAGLVSVLAPSFVRADTFTENFATDPATRGWQIFGDTNLFHWDAANQNLAVTWDSSQPNSYFYRPLGTVLTTNDDFSLSFDLELNDVTNTLGTFELAVGLLNLDNASATNFLRGTGFNSPNLVEFDYFLDPMYGPSLGMTEADTNCLFAFLSDFSGLGTNTVYHVAINHVAGQSLVTATMTVGGQTFSTFPSPYVETGFGDFRVGAVSVSSYNDTGSGATLLAHGTVANFSITTPAPPVQNLAGALAGIVWQSQFTSQTNWLYTLERTADLQSWSPASATASGTGGVMTLQDTNAPADNAFYRVRANRP